MPGSRGLGSARWLWADVLLLVPLYAVFVVMALPARYAGVRNAGILCAMFSLGVHVLWPGSTGRMSVADKLVSVGAAVGMIVGVKLVLVSVVLGALVAWRERRAARRGFAVIMPSEPAGRVG